MSAGERRASQTETGQHGVPQGLYDPALDKDSCGVGFIADGGHATACHRWTELPDEPGVTIHDAPPPALARLIAAFARPRPRDGSGRSGVDVTQVQ